MTRTRFATCRGVFLAALLLLSPSAVRASEPDAALSPAVMEFATATAPAAPTTGAIRAAEVIRVAGARVYINRGADDGLKKGMKLSVISIEEVTDLDGKVMAREEKENGELEAMEVHGGYAVAMVVRSGDQELARGMSVRYVVPEEAAKAVESAAMTSCPSSMVFIEPGSYTYYPPGAGQAPVRESVGSYCIDAKPGDAREWEAASALCKAAGKRLCEKAEYRKACASIPAMKKKCGSGDCAVPELNSSMAWSSDAPGDSPDGAGSCRCLASSPSCAGCFRPGCPGVRFRFHCCEDIAREDAETPKPSEELLK